MISTKKIVITLTIVVVVASALGFYLLWPSSKPEETPMPDEPQTPEEVLDQANDLAGHQDYRNAEHLYKELIRTRQAGPEVYYYLAELSYAKANGDRDPVLGHAVELYKQAIVMGYVDCMLKLADIYNFCNVAGTDIPNKEVSKALYTKIIRSSKVNPEVKITANLRLIELNRDQAMKNMNRTTRIQRQLPYDQILREHNIPVAPAYNVPVRRAPQERIVNVVRNDSQNVHDRQIQQAFTNSITKLKKLNGYNQRAIPQREIVEQIEEYVKNSMDLSQQTKNKALTTLGVMKKSNETITAANGIRETEILGLVWNRINAKENQDNRANLKEAFVHELADATVGGAPVCATGRVTRAINALEGTDVRDDVVRFRPKWALKEEIQGKAARVRDEILNDANEEEQDAYNTDGAGGIRAQNLANAVTERMKKELMNRCTKEYIDTGLMNKDELSTEVNKVAEAF